MKRITLTLIVLFPLFFASCKKKDTPDSVSIGTMQADINGSASTFNIEAVAVNGSISGSNMLTLRGYKKPRTTSGTYFEIVITNPGSIGVGTYTENNPGLVLVRASHFVDLFFGVGGTHSTYGSSSNPFNISITERSSFSVKGTFKGELKSGTGTSATTENVTKGIFHLRL